MNRNNVLAAALVVFLLASIARATTLTVTNANDSGAGSLRSAITSAGNGDTIVFSNTTSRGAVNFYDGAVRTIVLGGTELAVTSSVTITGPGDGVLTVSGNSASRVLNIGAGTTVSIDGVTIANGRTADGAPGTDVGGGPAGNGSDGVGGGGILVSGALTLSHSTVSGNRAGNGGRGGNSSVTGSTSNTGANGGSGGPGGGIYIAESGSLSLSSSRLSGNGTGDGGPGGAAVVGGNGASSGSGGGIYVAGNGTLTVTNTTLSGNHTGSGGGGGPGGLAIGIGTGPGGLGGNSGDGGGIYVAASGSFSVTESTLDGNSTGSGGRGGLGTSGIVASGTSGRGGGICVAASGTGAVVRSTVSSNSTAPGVVIGGNTGGDGSSSGHGGGIYVAGTLGVLDSTLSGNSAGNGGNGTDLGDGPPGGPPVGNGGNGGSGGGIYAAASGSLTVSNCTLNGNSTGSGGSGGTSSFGNGTSGSPGSGGGIFSGGTPSLGHTIVAGNTAANGGTGPDLRGSFSSNGYNLIGVIDGSSGPTNGVNGDQAGTLALPLDAKLDVLANNGGPTQTLALLAGSPAIDAGDPNFNPNSFNPPLTTDQRGMARVAQGKTATGAARVDIGAFEFDVTQTPTLTAPASSLVTNSPITVTFTLPEAALAGSVKLQFDQIAGSFTRTLTLATSQESAGTHTFTLDPANPVGSSAVASINPAAATLPDDSYNVTLSYQDAAGNSAATATNAIVKIDTLTLTPTLTKPTASSVSPNPMVVQFTLPEAALAGSVTLTFSNGTNVRTLHIKDGVTSLSFEVGDPGASVDVTSVDGGETIPDGTYTVTLSYQDELGNVAASAQKTGVVVDGTAPQISIDAASPLRRAFAGALGNYTALANVTDAHPDTVEQEPEPGTTMSVGIHTITLTAKDAAGNDSSATFDLDVRPLSAVNTKVVDTGHSAPGAGTNGLPADAKLASFNTPAIDDDGNIAFVAKWTSVTGPVKKGTGLFTNAACLAIVGGDVNGIPGAKYKSFTDPVISGGKVVCIAKLTGTPKPPASVVVSDLDTTGTLDVIGRAGDVATLADGTQPFGGAKFKSFKAAAINGGSVAVFAQLTGGTAPLATTSANDYGLWVKDATNPLSLVLRKGQMIDTRKIKTLIAFAPGIGSPGQGRGWLTQPHGPALLALALFTDKSQAVISATGGGGVTALTETDKTGVNGGPDISGATFASYSFPATNNTTTTFLASMTVGAGGVTKADARGVFLRETLNKEAIV